MGRERDRQRQAGLCLHSVLSVSGADLLGPDMFGNAAARPPRAGGLGRHRASAEQCSEHEGSPVLHQLLYPPLFDQVIDIPEALLEGHDLTVDYILTPTRVIATGCARPKPAGVVWSKVGSHVAPRAAAASRSQVRAIAQRRLLSSCVLHLAGQLSPGLGWP